MHEQSKCDYLRLIEFRLLMNGVQGSSLTSPEMYYRQTLLSILHTHRQADSPNGTSGKIVRFFCMHSNDFNS